jgi:4-hydroxybenzoate polyprenyltransferase
MNKETKEIGCLLSAVLGFAVGLMALVGFVNVPFNTMYLVKTSYLLLAIISFSNASLSIIVYTQVLEGDIE